MVPLGLGWGLLSESHLLLEPWPRFSDPLGRKFLQPNLFPTCLEDVPAGLSSALCTGSGGCDMLPPHRPASLWPLCPHSTQHLAW